MAKYSSSTIYSSEGEDTAKTIQLKFLPGFLRKSQGSYFSTSMTPASKANLAVITSNSELLLGRGVEIRYSNHKLILTNQVQKPTSSDSSAPAPKAKLTTRKRLGDGDKSTYTLARLQLQRRSLQSVW